MNLKKHLNDLTVKGYTLLENVISEKDCEKFKEFLEKDYKKYHKKYANYKKNASLSDKSKEKVVFNLHNKNRKWFELFGHKKILKILDKILRVGSFQSSEPYYLNNISARSPLKGNKGQPIHIDSNLPGINYNIITNVMWYFDDVNRYNGTTIVVPGSHRLRKYAPNKLNKIKNKKYIKAKKGSVLILNANLWHGGSKKDTDGSRWALVLGYARWFIKPSFDYMHNTPASIYKKLNSVEKALLGFNLIPPRDEFTRLRRRSDFFEKPYYKKI
tara:strand:- start:17589 stop:18404 length:816 start_codon:yes stop_codon:yes gene_type:complete